MSVDEAPATRVPLDAILQKVLDVVPFQLTSDGGPEACRQRFRDLPRAPVHPEVTAEDLTAGDVPVRVYRAPGASEATGSDTGASEATGSDTGTGPAAPAVVFFHGGGWVVGDLDTYDGTARAHAAGTGAVVVSVDYRLAPEHPFPAAIDDAWAATRWVVEHASELGIDPNRVAVAGDSAGGNLAAAVALLARDSDLPPLRFQLLWYPATTWDTSLPSFTENADAPILATDSVAAFSRWYAGHVDLATAPVTLIPARAESHAGVAPAYVAVAGHDPLRDDGIAYARLLQEAGVPAQVHNAESLVHGYVGYDGVVPVATEAVRLALGALREALEAAGE